MNLTKVCKIWGGGGGGGVVLIIKP
jgi:hypothetical protein